MKNRIDNVTVVVNWIGMLCNCMITGVSDAMRLTRSRVCTYSSSSKQTSEALRHRRNERLDWRKNAVAQALSPKAGMK